MTADNGTQSRNSPFIVTMDEYLHAPNEVLEKAKTRQVHVVDQDGSISVTLHPGTIADFAGSAPSETQPTISVDQIKAKTWQRIADQRAIEVADLRLTLEQECKDVDRILALFPHILRTEGGRLPVAKILNEISDLAARCKRAEK